MDVIKIKGKCERLDGELGIYSAKNSVLPMLACAIMTSGEVVLKNCKPLSDIVAMMDIIKFLGGVACFDGDNLHINCENLNYRDIDASLTGKIRSSIFILGPIIARFRRAQVSYPGGCDIGLRPIDLHLYGLGKLGVKIEEDNGCICCDGENLSGGEISLDFPSVGATENCMMVASLASGTTIIRNCAREPEIVDLANFINAVGGKVLGAGRDTIIVEGVKQLHGCVYSPLSDRIVAGTYLTACAMTGGDLLLRNISPENLFSVIEKLNQAGAKIYYDSVGLRIKSSGKIKSVHKIETQPYPGFPTDMQPQILAMLSVSNGCSVVIENLFESRFKYTVQLLKMGAKVTVRDRVAVVKGVKCLHGADVLAQDLRGGASLILAGLVARGETIVRGIEHVDRGYWEIESALSSVGANIARIRE